MEYNSILREIHAEVTAMNLTGKVASYIPELAHVDSTRFGIHLLTTDGQSYAVGESQERFSIQSISKVLSLAFILPLLGESIWNRVGVEPSGDPFNSIVQLEYENGIPRNPFINAGALVISDLILSHFANPKKEFEAYVNQLANTDTIQYNARVVQSEKQHRDLNAALAHMMKSYGNIHHDVEDVLDLYFHQCALEMTCEELARAFLMFANQGKVPHLHTPLLTESQVKRINALMLSCGFYDESGEFAYKVGLPGKSGVGGGIVAIHPQKFSVAVWSPLLNEKGNSELGMNALEMLTTKTNLSIF